MDWLLGEIQNILFTKFSNPWQASTDVPNKTIQSDIWTTIEPGKTTTFPPTKINNIPMKNSFQVMNEQYNPAKIHYTGKVQILEQQEKLFPK